MVTTGPENFAGMAPEFLNEIKLLTSVANWADLATAPAGTRVVHDEDGIKGEEQRDVGGGFDSGSGGKRLETVDNRPPDLPVQGLTIDRFFTAARALSGQDLTISGGKGSPHERLTAEVYRMLSNVIDSPVRNGVPAGSGLPSFVGAIHDFFDKVNWTGKARDGCQKYSYKIEEFLTPQAENLGHLADSLTAYNAIIFAARQRMLSLMRAFVGNMTCKMSADAKQVASMVNFLVGISGTVLSTLVGLNFSMAALPALIAKEVAPTVLPAFSNMVISLGGAIVQNANSDKVDVSHYSVIVHDYLTNADALVADTRARINGLADQLKALNRVIPPPPPLTDSNEGQLTPQHG